MKINFNITATFHSMDTPELADKKKDKVPQKANLAPNHLPPCVHSFCLSTLRNFQVL